MKWIVIAVVVALLVLAQIVFGGRNSSQAETPSEPVAEAVEVAVAAPEEKLPEQTEQADQAGQTEPEEPILPALPAPDDVTAIAAGDGLRLVRGGGGWTLAERDNFPADQERIAAFLTGLLAVEQTPVPPGEVEDTGLENDGGLPIALTLKDGSVCELRLGLRPAGSYDSAYIRLPGGGVIRAHADVRGDLGLWRNTPSALPEPSDWIQKTILSFAPEDATRLEATYPDHRILFAKSPEGEWRAEGYVPGGDWNREAFAAWLAALADFRIADVVDISPEEFSEGDGSATHRIDISLAGGGSVAVRVRPDHGGEGMLAAASSFPGRAFRLPEWRFREYFHVLSPLFPDAVPHFEPARVRFIDILQDGEKVKIARRDDGWEALALPHPVRAEQADRLARFLAAWHPEEYASPEFKTVRPNYGAPMVEITLDDGVVHQYRLGGRHPLFPGRYVTLDGKEIFSVTDSEAGVMFPKISKLLELETPVEEVAENARENAEPADTKEVELTENTPDEMPGAKE